MEVDDGLGEVDVEQELLALLDDFGVLVLELKELMELDVADGRRERDMHDLVVGREALALGVLEPHLLLDLLHGRHAQLVAHAHRDLVHDLLIHVDVLRLDLLSDLGQTHLARDLVLELAHHAVHEHDLAVVRLHGHRQELNRKRHRLAPLDLQLRLRHEEHVDLRLLLRLLLVLHLPLLNQLHLELAELLRALREDVCHLYLAVLLLVQLGLHVPHL